MTAALLALVVDESILVPALVAFVVTLLILAIGRR